MTLTTPASPASPTQPWWRQSRFHTFVASRTISQAGDMAAVTALSIHVYALTGSGLAVGGLYVVRVLPRILALFSGAIGDRLELRRLLIRCDLFSGLAFAAVTVLDPGYSLLLALVFLAECAATVTLPAARTMVGRTVDSEHLTSANGALLASVSLGFATGSALGGLAATSFDYRWAIGADALSFVLSAALMRRLAPCEPPARTTAAASFLAQTLAGLSLLRRDRDVMPVVVGLLGVAFAASIDRPALLILVRTDLRASGLWYGLALGGVALGAFAVSLGATKSRAINGRTAAYFSAGILSQGVGHLVMGLTPALLLLVVGALVAGFGNGLESVCGTTLLQRSAPKESLGVLMGVVLSGSFLANALGSIAGGALVDITTARWTFVIAAAVILFSGLPGVLTRRPGRKPSEPQPHGGPTP